MCRPAQALCWGVRSRSASGTGRVRLAAIAARAVGGAACAARRRPSKTSKQVSYFGGRLEKSLVCHYTASNWNTEM